MVERFFSSLLGPDARGDQEAPPARTYTPQTIMGLVHWATRRR